MKTWTIGGLAVFCTITCVGPALAQRPEAGRVFVDAAMMTERDPTDFFYGSEKGTAWRGAVGVSLSGFNGFRFEIDVPRWRAYDAASSFAVCGESAGCVGGPGRVPANIRTHVEVRTVSYAVLYARHVPVTRRIGIDLLGGGSVEDRVRRESGLFDELSSDGRVLRHSVYEDNRAKTWFAGVLGADVAVKLTPHLSLTPQFRFHTFPYPPVSIVRPGVALRWRF